MSSLREIKDRIGSVRSTLKITNAMKLVSSAKLRKAQQAIEALRPYEATLSTILAAATSTGEDSGRAALGNSLEGRRQNRAKMQHPPVISEGGVSKTGENASATDRIAVVAVASNSSLCGSFNGNVLRRTLEVLHSASGSAITAGEATAPDPVRGSAAHPSQPGGWAPPSNGAEGGTPLGGSASPAVDVYPIGRRIADPLRKAGYPAAAGSGNPAASGSGNTAAAGSGNPAAVGPEKAAAIDLNELAAHPSYEAAAELAQSLADAYAAGVYTKVILIYNHFVSSSRQEVVCETYLPFEVSPSKKAENVSDPGSKEGVAYDNGENRRRYILEPSAADITKTLLPQVMRLKIYAMLLDSAAAEHAARMIAMQTATDNAQDILDELTLEYNKGRQQQITAEILDIVGGSQQ